MKHRDKLLWTFPSVAIALLLLFCTINPLAAETTLPAEDIAEKALAATVYLEMKDKNGKTLGIGSGFFVKHNLIATNYHVIEGAAKGTAKLVGKNTTDPPNPPQARGNWDRKYNIEGVTATDKTNDLALLKVTAFGIKPLSLGDSDKVRIGETVYVAGNPKGLEGTFSDGIISSRRDKLAKERLQMTAPISPGSSGGPVLNRKGEVIGVSFMTLEGGQNLNFAIPSKYLKKLLEKSKQAERFPSTISAETYFLWGNAKYDLGDYKGAIKYYTHSIRLKPDPANAAKVYYNRGVAKDELGQDSAAISDLDITIRLKPDLVEAYVSRGIIKYDLGQHFAAISDFDRAIDLKPNYALAYTNRGFVKANLGQYAAAIEDYNIAIKLNPESAQPYVNRGHSKYKSGRTQEAKQDFQKALKLAEEADDKNLKTKLEEILRNLNE